MFATRGILFGALTALSMIVAPAMAMASDHPEHHGAEAMAHPAGHGEGHGEMRREEHHSGFHVEAGGGLSSGYERYGVIVTDETASKGFVGLGFSMGGGLHAGIHGMMVSTSKEQVEREVSPHIGWHGHRLDISAAYNSVEHTNHNFTTTEAQLTAGYKLTHHLTLDLLLNWELDREKRSYHGAGVSYQRPLGGQLGLRFKAMANYLNTSGIVSSHGGSHEAGTSEETATADTEGSSHEAREGLAAGLTQTAGAETSTETGASFSGLHNSSIELALDYSPHHLHGLTVTGFARAVNPLSDDAKKDLEARSFDGKTSAITMVGLEASLTF
ncbi:MAG: hypothetical protein HY751_14225 [Nitrospinae bacterium]|nr:hypothetical protein [Nitrospinota bacterium]